MTEMTDKADKADIAENAEVAEDLMQRRFSLMVAQVLSVRFAFGLTMLAAAAVAWQSAPPALVLSWLAGGMLVFGLRAAWLVRHTARTDVASAVKVRGAVAWNLALGLSFGLSAGFMAWLDVALSAVLTTIVVSTAAGAVAISGPLLPVYLGYTLGIMLPFALAWLLIGGLLGAGLALLMCTFVALQYGFALKVSQMFTESFMIRRENEQLVGQLTVARDQADAASRAKTRFLAAASHDLRQPLHALSLQSSALLLDPRAEDTPDIAAAIADSIEDVVTLLDSLLDISKLDAGTMRADKRPIHLSRLLDALGRSFGLWAEEKGLSFELHNPSGQIAVTDPILLERVLRNLVDNAIKYTPSGVVGMALRPTPDHFEIAVTDSGVGIAPELQSKVFDEFYQVGRHAHGHTQGLGLGLSIVNRLAQLLGMALELVSTPGQGTTVFLRLPRSDADKLQPAIPPIAAPDVDLAGLRVLVLDDEPAICAGMAALLRRLGCEVRTALSVAEARLLVREFCPQIVLADYRLEDNGNGIEAVAALRSDRPDLLALLISGDTAPDRLREASASGLDLLYKPVSLDQLKRALSRLLAVAD